MKIKSALTQGLTMLIAAGLTFADDIPEIIIIASSQAMISIYEDADYWGVLDPNKILDVPPLLVVATVKEWRQEAAAMTVQDKKELFYRSLLPLVLYANKVIADERKHLQALSVNVASHGYPDEAEAAWLLDLAVRYHVIKVKDDKQPTLASGRKLAKFLDELLKRVDTIPASLALGQGAYESGYGTSRFALEGNSFFGQWTYGGKGMAPREKRAGKGNYGVAAYAWPLDSVESYMMNLNTHRAYSGLRKKRAALRKDGRKVRGSELVKTLDHYSERGAEYVKTLTGIMRVNGLDVADDARLLQQPLVLIVNAADKKDASLVADEISGLRASGELGRLVHSMGIAR